MSWLVLEGAERRLAVRNGQLVVELHGDIVHRVDPAQVDEIHLMGNADLTAAARSLVLRQRISVTFMSRTGRYQGRLLFDGYPAGERRLAQLRAIQDDARRLDLARAVVHGKLSNQCVPLLRAQRAAPSESLADAVVAIRGARDTLPDATTLNELRGMEGYAARRYFGVFDRALRNPLFEFNGRNRRPPLDPVNAMLSFAYTLLVRRLDDAVRLAGLDPLIGVLHDAGRGRPALALDLAEEWRPLVDALVIGLVNRRQVCPEDFIHPHVDLGAVGAPPDPGDVPPPKAVHMDDVARRVMFHAWDARLRERVLSPTLDGRFTLADVMRQQARHMGACMDDPSLAYRPFAWR